MGPPLRQLRYFYYISGLNAANCIVTYDIAKDLLVVWLPPVPAPRLVLYNGPIPTAEEVLGGSEVDRVERQEKLGSYLTSFAHRKEGLIYVSLDFEIVGCLMSRDVWTLSLVLEDMISSQFHV